MQHEARIAAEQPRRVDPQRKVARHAGGAIARDHRLGVGFHEAALHVGVSGRMRICIRFRVRCQWCSVSQMRRRDDHDDQTRDPAYVGDIRPAAAGGRASAQVYPSRPVTMVVPLAAGGPLDTLARLLAEPMRAALGQPVIVENVTGAGGTVGTGRVARAAPDGYTIGMGFLGTHVLNGAIYALPYDVVKDFEPIALISSNPHVIVAKAALPAKDLRELIGWLKLNPDKASAGTAGVGASTHVAGLLFQQLAGVRFQLVPYRGAAPALQDVMAGQIDLMVDVASNSLPYLQGGRIKAFAVTANTRLASAPAIPTVDEAGLPGFHMSTWYALFGPKGDAQGGRGEAQCRGHRMRWPIRRSAGGSPTSDWTFRRATSRPRTRSRRSSAPRSRSGGRSSRRPTSSRNRPRNRTVETVARIECQRNPGRRYHIDRAVPDFAALNPGYAG